MVNNLNLTVLGLWHLGLVNAVGFAELGIKVLAYDSDRQKISQLQKGISPIYEPSLEELLKKNLKKGNLVFTNSLKDLKKTSLIMIASDTPINERDEVDLKPIFALVKKISAVIEKGALVVISSQVPIGTTEKIAELLQKEKSGVKVAYIPENLRLGKAMERFFKPQMIVIGASDRETYDKLCLLYQKIEAHKIFTSIKTAEMVKHAINSFLATSISFANELGNLSEAVGADFLTVAKIIKKDERIGEWARILPGLGFAGGTLARDLKILLKLGKEEKQPINLVKAVLQVNEKQKNWVVDKLNKIFHHHLSGKKIGILGLTYTPNTSTLRRSLAVETIKKLLKKKAEVIAYDPRVSRQELARHKKIITADSWQKLVKKADALVLMTQWPDFLTLPWPEIKGQMNQPVIIDAHNFLVDLNLKKYGFVYFGVGRGTDYEKI